MKMGSKIPLSVQRLIGFTTLKMGSKNSSGVRQSSHTQCAKVNRVHHIENGLNYVKLESIYTVPHCNNVNSLSVRYTMEFRI